MPNAFNFSVSPFDCLDPAEQRLVRDQVDIACFRPGEVLLETGARPAHLFVVIKGYVQQFEGEEMLATYGPNDSFDGRALVAGYSGCRYVAVDEVLVYELSHEAVNRLIASNDTFSALLFSALGKKLRAAAGRHAGQELQSLHMARVADAWVRPARMVPATMPVLEVVRSFRQERTRNVLVQASGDTARLGIFTTSDLQRAVLDGRPLDALPVGELASWSLIAVHPSQQVGEALTLMLRHGVHRVVVQQADGQVAGVLEALDVFSFLSNHSLLIDMQLRDAASLDDLAQAAGQITAMIGRQFRAGVRVGLLAQLVQQLNGRLFERAWQLLAPEALVRNSCLLVMGSEGRGEQLLRTDQDNALLLRDGYEPPQDLAGICERFSAALARFGYPPCPGGVMLNRPSWRGTETVWRQRIRHWLVQPDGGRLMDLAIFMDAHAVAGDASLLEALRMQIWRWLADDDAMMSRFAAAVDAFGDTTRWWQRMLGGGEAHLNVKKAGLFPLVHGVRSLALASRIEATGTEARIQALQEQGVLSVETAQELVEALHFFMALRLQAGMDEQARGLPVSGKADLARLTPLQRDLLKDALAEVRRFRTQLRLRFRLGAVQ